MGEACETLRSRITRESEIIRKTQATADDARREVNRLEPRIDQAMKANVNVTKCFGDLGNLDATVRLEMDRTTGIFEATNSSMNTLELKMQKM